MLLSRAEGLPQVLVQAAAVGTPFVVTEVDGADELLELGAAGTVVEQGDVIGAARALLPYLRWRRSPPEPAIDLTPWRAETDGARRSGRRLPPAHAAGARRARRQRRRNTARYGRSRRRPGRLGQVDAVS